MTREDLMKLAAQKAFKECSWKSIEYLFRPMNYLELLLRLDFEGTEKKIYEWMVDNSPDALPHRFRVQYVPELLRAIEVEEFYREIKELREEQVN